METVVICPAFGAPSSIRSNTILRNELLICCEAYQATTIYSQDALGLNKDSRFNNYLVKCVPQTKPKKHPSTLTIMRFVAWGAVMDDNADRLVTVAAPPHAERCKRDQDYALRDQWNEERLRHITLDLWRMSQEYSDNEWFCKNSEQFWTRKREAWERRENVLMRMPPWAYVLVAG